MRLRHPSIVTNQKMPTLGVFCASRSAVGAVERRSQGERSYRNLMDVVRRIRGNNCRAPAELRRVSAPAPSRRRAKDEVPQC